MNRQYSKDDVQMSKKYVKVFKITSYLKNAN